MREWAVSGVRARQLVVDILHRLCFGPDVAADGSDREENHDPGGGQTTLTTEAIEERPPPSKVLSYDDRIACSHMSGLIEAVTHDRGPRWFPQRERQHSGGLLPPLHAAAFLTSRIDRSPSARFLARSDIKAAGSLRLCCPAAPIRQVAEAATGGAALAR